MSSKLSAAIAILFLGTLCLSFGVTGGPFGQAVLAAANPTERVEIYITDWCPYCAKAVKFLQANQIPYVAYDIEKDKEAAARYKGLSGGRGVPFAIINGKKIYGFSVQGYSQALGLKDRP